MKIKLFIDNNVWDIFFDNKTDINGELSDVFDLAITREAELEIESMPDELKSYVTKMCPQLNVKTDLIFGFHDRNKPKDKQTVGGFSSKFHKSRVGGRFARIEELESVKNEKHLINCNKLKKTGLYPNEADIALVLRASHSVILTCDSKKALKRAAQNTNNIVDLKKWDKNQPLKEFILNEICENKTS